MNTWIPMKMCLVVLSNGQERHLWLVVSGVRVRSQAQRKGVMARRGEAYVRVLVHLSLKKKKGIPLALGPIPQFRALNLKMWPDPLMHVHLLTCFSNVHIHVTFSRYQCTKYNLTTWVTNVMRYEYHSRIYVYELSPYRLYFTLIGCCECSGQKQVS